MRWKQVHSQVSILQCEAPMDCFSLEQLVLYSRLPTQVEAEQPEPVEHVAVTWNGTDITWMDGETVQECVNVELSDATDADKIRVQKLLEKEKERKTASHKHIVENNKTTFRNMIEANDMSVEALQARHVYKVYPQDPRLEPTPVSFGDIHETGFL